MDGSRDYVALEKSVWETLSRPSLAPLSIDPAWVTRKKHYSWTTSGGFGDVDVDVELRKPGSPAITVVVKKLRPDGDPLKRIMIGARLAREILVWAGLNHPNILPLTGFHLDANLGAAWLVSPYMWHGNVKQWLERYERQSRPGLAKRISLAMDTAEGLAYLHGLDPPIFHGDLKAANVLVNDIYHAVLCDFGLSKTLTETPTGLTTSSDLQGTPAYLSSELADGGAHTLESDIWAWGCLSLEILVDDPPHKDAGNNLLRLYTKIAANEMPSDLKQPQLTNEIRALLRDCWNRDPARRPSASECIGRLTAKNEAPSTGQISEDSLTVDHPPFASGSYTGLFKGDLHTESGRFKIAIKTAMFHSPTHELWAKIDEGFQDEMKLWLDLKHPRITPFLGFLPRSNKVVRYPCLITPFRSNGDILQYLRTRPDVDRILLLIQVAEGLAYLHGIKPVPVVHTHVKPSNVLINDNGEAELCDVDMARIISYLSDDLTYVSGHISHAGPPAFSYIAPEVLHGLYPLPPADMFAFGCLILEVMSGHPPHYKLPGGAQTGRVFRGEHARREDHPLEHLSVAVEDALWTLMTSCWATTPDDRIEAEQALRELKQVRELHRALQASGAESS